MLVTLSPQKIVPNVNFPQVAFVQQKGTGEGPPDVGCVSHTQKVSEGKLTRKEEKGKNSQIGKHDMIRMKKNDRKRDQ